MIDEKESIPIKHQISLVSRYQEGIIILQTAHV